VLRAEGNDRKSVGRALNRARPWRRRSRRSSSEDDHRHRLAEPRRHGEDSRPGARPGGNEAHEGRGGWPDEPTFAVAKEVRKRFASIARERSDARSGRRGSRRGSREAGRLCALGRDVDARGRRRRGRCSTPRSRADAGPKATRAHSAGRHPEDGEGDPRIHRRFGGPLRLDEQLDRGLAARRTAEEGHPPESATFVGRNFHFGVREHAMGAVTNGIAAHGAFHPALRDILQFLDLHEADGAARVACRSTDHLLYTHDSIASRGRSDAPADRGTCGARG